MEVIFIFDSVILIWRIKTNGEYCFEITVILRKNLFSFINIIVDIESIEKIV